MTTLLKGLVCLIAAVLVVVRYSDPNSKKEPQYKGGKKS